MTDAVDPVVHGGLILAGILLSAWIARSLRDRSQRRGREWQRQTERGRAVEGPEPPPAHGPVTDQDRADLAEMMAARGYDAALAWQLVRAERTIRAAGLMVTYAGSGRGDGRGSDRPSAAGRTARPLAADPRTELERLRAAAADRLVIFDSETTGLGNRAEILEYALVGPDGTVLAHSVVRPTTRIQAGALAIHGITRAEANKHDRITEHADRLVGLMRERVVVAYNAEFDRRLLEQTFERYALRLPVLDWVCAMRAYQAFAGHHRAVTLEEALEVEGLDITATHRAAADAEATRQLVRHLRKVSI